MSLVDLWMNSVWRKMVFKKSILCISGGPELDPRLAEVKTASCPLALYADGEKAVNRAERSMPPPPPGTELHRSTRREEVVLDQSCCPRESQFRPRGGCHRPKGGGGLMPAASRWSWSAPPCLNHSKHGAVVYNI